MRTIHLASALSISLLAPLALAAAIAPGPDAEPVSEPQPMLFYWRATLDHERATAPTEFLVRLMTQVKENHPDARLRILTNSFTKNDTVHWFMEHEGLTARMQFERELETDRGWDAIMEEAAQNFDLENDFIVSLFPLGGAGLDDRSKPVRQLRVTHSSPERTLAAQRFARRVVEYLEATYEAVDARAYSADFSSPGTIYWMVDYENPSTWESIRGALLEDDAYSELLEGGEGLFLEESTVQMMRDF